MPSASMQRQRFPWGTVLGGLLIYLTIQALFVGLPGFSGSSEAREAQVVDTILREGNWVLPLRNGVIPSKPPLYHWIAATVSYGLGGISEFSTRYTSQLCAAVCMLLVALTTFRFAEATRSYQSPRHARRAALVAAGTLSLTYGFYQMGCQAMVDMTFAMCVWLVLVSVALTVKTDNTAKAPVPEVARALFWLFCSVAVLARGPLGVVLPIALCGVAGCCTLGLLRTIKLFVYPSFGWLAFAIPIVWYYLAYQVGGDAFLDRQLFFENIKRFSGGEFVNSEPWWFYIPSVLRTTFPWGIILLWIFFKSVARPQTLSYPMGLRRVRWLPSILLCTGIVLFSLSSGKRHSYLLPLLPLIAVQLGVELSSLFEREGDRARARASRVGRITEVVLTGAGMALLFVVGICGEFGLNAPGYLRDAYMAIPLVIARLSILIVGCGLIAFVGIRRSLPALFGSVWFVMLILMTGAIAAGMSVKAHLKGFDDMSRAWLSTAGESERLAVFKHPFDEYFDPILYYVHRPVTLFPLEAVLSECRPGTVYAAKQAWLNAHEEAFKGDIVRILTVRERLLAQRDDSARDIVFFRCGTYGRGGQQSESPMLQDAAYR